MKILVVSPHPDDETLGAGGTLLKFRKEGAKLFWLNFTNMREEYGYLSKDIRKRQVEIQKVAKLYGFRECYDLQLEPCALSDYPKKELIEKTADILKRIRPEVIILPFKNDPHSDHRIVFDTLYSSTKVFRAPFIKEILMMEILSETDSASMDYVFNPNYFIDVSAFMKKKIKILQYYKSELAQHPFPRSVANVRALATYRGAMAGCGSAESFILLRKIIK